MFYSDSYTNTSSYAAFQAFNTWYRSIHGYASLVICLLGMTLNFFNIIVLTRKHMISSTNTILTALAVSDFITMIVYIPTSLKFYCVLDNTFNKQSNCFDLDSSREVYFWTAYVLFYVNVSVTMHSISIWLTVLLALFRYLYVCHNKIGKKLCTRKNTILAIIFTYLFCVILCIPSYMVSKIVEANMTTNATSLNNNTIIQSNSNTKKLYELSQSDVDAYFDGLIFRITFFSQAFCIKLIPCLLLIILSSLLIHSIQVANKNNKRLMALGRKTRESEKSKEHTRTNTMLVLVCVLFFVTEFPQGILAILSIIFESSNFHSNIYMKLGDIMDIVALINNAINFILYCSMSHIFRQTFKNIFCKPLCLKYKKFNNSIKSYRTNSSFYNGGGGSFNMKSMYNRYQSDAFLNNDENAAVNFNFSEQFDQHTELSQQQSQEQKTRLSNAHEGEILLKQTKFNSPKKNKLLTLFSPKNKCNNNNNNNNTRRCSENNHTIKENGAIHDDSVKKHTNDTSSKAVRFSIS